MIANCGPADYNYDETIRYENTVAHIIVHVSANVTCMLIVDPRPWIFSTLRYANRAKNIKNRAQINEDPKDALLRQLQKEMEELKRQLSEQGEESGSEEDDASGG